MNVVAGLLLLGHAPVSPGFHAGFAAVVRGAAPGGMPIANHFHRWRTRTAAGR
ncbi:hypothetical protein [Solimonas soli]|uniref:hypothetical protein n=1 Tax=Solimonas soli TaxID=413479 RepID=UPI0004B28532|nr:hypothetical protein [Solimonas soli]